MPVKVDNEFARVAIALGGGGCGSVIALLLGLPVPFLTGSALFVGLAAMMGLSFQFPRGLHKIVFALIGLNIGSGVSAETLKNALDWPLSILLLCCSVVVTLALASFALGKFLKLGREEALLTASPGHLSFVLALGLQRNMDTSVISVAQTMRVFFLTLAVPFLFIGEAEPNMLSNVPYMPWAWIILLLIATILITPMLTKAHIPAAPLIAGMLISTLVHITGVEEGRLPLWLTNAVFIALGTLIGSRFVGVTLKKFRASLPAGIIITSISIVVATFFAWIDCLLLGISFVQAFVSFAPGGLETMIAISTQLNVDTGFVAAHHLTRFFILTPILIWLLSKQET